MTTAEAPNPTVASAADLDTADDRVLVEAFARGRCEAFDVIVTRHQRHIYRLCFRFVGNHEDAADLTQDVFIRAFRSLGRFKQESALGTWLYRIAVNTCLNRAAEKKPARESLDGIDVADPRAADPLRAAMTHEAARALRAAIRRLPPKQRATVVLRMYEDLSHQEIARILGGTVGAAKANLFHALGNLRRLVKS